MHNIIQAIKSINIRQILTVFLAGCLLVVSTACSRGNMAQVEGKTYADAAKTAERDTSNTYDKYDANQSFKGGMNRYNDDPRYDAETAAKTKALVDTAKNRQADNAGKYVENIKSIGDRTDDNIKQAKRDIPRNIQANTEKASEYILDKSGNLKDNLSKVPRGAREVFDDAKDNAKNAVKDAI